MNPFGMYPEQDIEVKRWRAERENASARLALAETRACARLLISQHDPVSALGINRDHLKVLLDFVQHHDVARLRRESEALLAKVETENHHHEPVERQAHDDPYPDKDPWEAYELMCADLRAATAERDRAQKACERMGLKIIKLEDFIRRYRYHPRISDEALEAARQKFIDQLLENKSGSKS